MGYENRNLAACSKTSAAPSTAIVFVVDGGAAFSDNVPNPTTKTVERTEAIVIKFECEKALATLRRGNHTKALRLMNNLCSKHENSPHSALIHRVQGTVCVKVASIFDDPNVKQSYLKNAIESARKATTLSPNSIEFAHFYANLLYEAANDAKHYEEVVMWCERALAIENPVDPAEESLQEESQQQISTPEARVAHVQSELRSLIQKSNIASISSWMKNLGNCDEKFRLIPRRRVAEDPMELRKEVEALLQDVAEKDAAEKSDAAKKGGGGGGENLKHAHEKTEEKKKDKDLKVTGELNMPHEQMSEEISLPKAHDGDNPDGEGRKPQQKMMPESTSNGAAQRSGSN